uniref:Tetraspanin-7 n=1 Tax=Aceria tosichella TaxID=561515 RepID=A0A6G1S9Z0_9ACAR
MDSNKLKRKTIYSPVDLHSSDLLPIENHPTLAKLRYLDDTSGEDELGINNHQEAGFSPAKNTTAKPFEKCPNPKATGYHQQQQQQQKQYGRQQFSEQIHHEELGRSTTSNEESDDHNNDDPYNRRQQQREQEHLDDDEASLEEVYLCSCCGITRPLDPAMKYMPLFKSLFILFNFLVFAFGLASLGMGLWFRIDPKVYEIHKYIETQNFTLAGWMMLVAGFIACLMALVAFAYISKHSVCMLIFYSITMTLLTVSSISSLVLLTVYGLGASLERFMSKEIYEQIRRRTMSTELDLSTSSDAAQFLDFVQVKLRCCGAQDFRDYQKLGMVIPTTCYTIAANYINAPGCGQALRRLFDIRAGMATGFLAGGVIVQIVSVVLASLMVCSIYNWRATSRPASAASYPRSPINSRLGPATKGAH